MYTLAFIHSQKPNTFFFQNGVGESPAGAQKNAETPLTNESQARVQAVVQKVLEEFDKNPQFEQAAVDRLTEVKDRIFSDPKMFEAFVNKAFENRDAKLKSLKGEEKTKYLTQFSTFITDVMIQFADMNQFSEFKAKIDERRNRYLDGVEKNKEKTTATLASLKNNIVQV